MEVRPGYKQTEVGVIPEAWECCRLADLLDKSRHIRYGIVQPGKFDTAGCFMLRSQDYSKGWAGPDNMHKVNRTLENQYRNARIHHNDLVITIVGAGIGQVVTVPAWLDGAILSRSTARIAIDDEKAARAFVSALLEGPVGKRQIQDCQKEGAQPVVSCVDLAKFFVPLPPIPEQRAIATALSDVDALLVALELLIAKKRDLKQATMQELLTGRTRLPDFHGEWEVKPLGDLFDVFAGGDFDPKRTSVERDEQYPFPVYSNAVSDLGLYGFCSYSTYTANTITVTARGTLGVSNYRDHPYTAIGRVLVLKPRAEVDGRFISAFIHNRISFVVESTGVPQLTAPQIAKYEIYIPPTEEQAAIATILTDMDVELAALEQRLAKTHALKQGMMQELLTGRTRLV